MKRYSTIALKHFRLLIDFIRSTCGAVSRHRPQHSRARHYRAGRRDDRRLTIGFALLLLFASTFAVHSNETGQLQEHSDILGDLKFPELEFEPVSVQTRELPSGARLLTVADETLPYLEITLHFPGGTNAEAVDDAGLLNAMLKMLEIGGAGERDGAAVALALADLGARLSFSPGYESWEVHLTVLKPDFPAAFAILSDSLLRPRLDADQLNTVKNQMLVAIDQRDDQPESIARIKLNEIMYPNMRAGYEVRPEDVARLNMENIRAELRRRLYADNMYISVSGDFQGLQLEEKLNALLSAFPAQQAPAAEDDSYAALRARADTDLLRRIVLIEYPRATQAVIAIGGHLPAHNHPDFFALQTGNYILGGGSFNSRLMRQIRVDAGLAYYAYSYNDFDARSGRYVASTGTRVAKTGDALRMMLAIMDGMHSTIQPEDVQLAQDSILNGFVFQFQSPAQIVDSEVRFRMHAMPENYLRVFPDRIRAQSAADIQRVYRNYVHAGNRYIVVVGPAELKAQLEQIRPVLSVRPDEAIRP
ncbi:MAG: insulinase family protein [Leptospiraceae bacterium]|nr:insulinase family protein [Leptospiraceae bacterium]